MKQSQINDDDDDDDFKVTVAYRCHRNAVSKNGDKNVCKPKSFV